MTGKTHKALGVVTGIAMVIYSIKANQPMYALGLATAPFGAMLPDIDHDRTKLGVARKRVTKIIRICIIIQMVLSTIVGVYYDMFFKPGEHSAQKILCITVPISVIILLADSEEMKKKHKFFHRHRGIMHTMFIPILLLAAYYCIPVEVIKMLSLGLCLGYTSHLIADMHTYAGDPLAWPLSEINVRIGRVVTGTVMETVVAVVLGIGIVVSSYFIAKDPTYLKAAYGYLAYAVFYALPNMLEKPLAKGKNKKRKSLPHNLLIPIGLFVLWYLFVPKTFVNNAISVGTIAGLVMSDIDFIEKQAKARS